MGVFLEQRAREDGKAGDGLTQPGKGGGDVSARNTGAPLRRDRAFLIVMTTINTNIIEKIGCSAWEGWKKGIFLSEGFCSRISHFIGELLFQYLFRNFPPSGITGRLFLTGELFFF